MINKTEIHKIFDFKNLSLSKDIIRNNGLCGIVIREYPGLIQCEWLENAFSACGNKKVYFFTFEKNTDGFEIKLINCDKMDIFLHMTDSIGQDLCIFSYDISGIFFKCDDYYIMCGTKVFIERAYPVSFETSKEVFFCDFRELSIRQRELLSSVWETYASNSCYGMSSGGGVEKPSG